LDCPYIDSTTQKPYTGTRKTTCHKKTFSPTAAFLQKWNNARNNYLQKDKSYYDATQKHSSSIAKSNMAAKGFKDEIDELAKVKVKECDVGRKVGVLADVKEFNTQNTNRAILFRSVEVIKCHVKSMHKSATAKSKKNSKLNTCIAKVKSEAWLKKHKFKDISKPIKFCPSVQEYRNKLKLKYGMDLHYTGDTNAIVTDKNGVVSTKYGWYPRTQQCADVKKKLPAKKTCTSSLKKHIGSLYIRCENIHKYCNLEEVTGNVMVDGKKCTTLKGLDKLTKIGGALRIGTHGGTHGLTSLCGFGNSKTRVARDIGVKAGAKICFQAGCAACAKFGRCDYPRCSDGKSTNSLRNNYGMKWCTDQKEIDAQKAGQPCP